MDDLDATTALQSLPDSSQPSEGAPRAGYPAGEDTPMDAATALAALPRTRQDPEEAVRSLIKSPLPTRDEIRVQAATEHYAGKAEEYWGPGSGDYLIARTPGSGLVKALADAYDLSGAMSRYKEGKHSDMDLYTIAQHHAKTQYQAERSKSLGSQAFDFATHAPGLLAEFAASGGATAGIGEAVASRLGGSVAARLAGYGAQTAAMTALTPSMYVEQAATANIDKGRNPLDPRGLAPAYGLAAAEMGVMGAVQKFVPMAASKLTGMSFEGSGPLQALTRVVMEGATGPFAQAAADVLHGAVDRQAGFGSIGDFVNGRFGDGMQKAAMHAMQFATFGLAHEITTGGKGHGEAKDSPVIKAFVEAASDLHKQGVLTDAAGKLLQTPKDIIDAIHAKDPNASRETIEAAMQGLPEGPLRDLGMKMAGTIPTVFREDVTTPQSPTFGEEVTTPGQGVRADAGSERPVTSQQEVSQEPPKTAAPGDSVPATGPTDAATLPGGSGEPSQPPTVPPVQAERRKNDVERKRVADMTPEERARELLTSQTVNLPNRRAFDEGAPSPVVGMSDADGLKAFNDTHGYEAGNALLHAKAEALKLAGVDAYHDKGDEFLQKDVSPEALRAKMDKAREILRNSIIEVTLKDGTVKRYKGADFSYGVGNDLTSAESGLKEHKAKREAAGERARGELRGITEVAQGGNKVGEGGVGSQRPTPAPAKPVGKWTRAIVDALIEKGATPHDVLDNLFNAAKLSNKQKHILFERATNPEKPHQQIGEELGLKGNKVRQNIWAAEKRAREKVEKLTGEPFETTFAGIAQRDAASAAADAKEAATPGKSGLVAENLEQAGGISDPEARFQDKWTKNLQAIRESDDYKNASPEERRAIDDEWTQRYQTSVANRKAWLRELKLLKQTEAFKHGDKDDRERLFDELAQRFQSDNGPDSWPTEETPVPPKQPVDVQPREAQQGKAAAPSGEGTKTGGSNGAAGPASPIPPTTQLRLNEMVKANDRRGWDDLREALRATGEYSEEEIAQARKIAGKWGKVPEPERAPVLGSWHARDQGGLRKHEVSEQLRQEMEDHRMHGGEDPANQEIEVAPGVFFNKGQSVSKFIAPEEHVDVVTQARRAGRTASQTEKLIRQVESEVAQQLAEEIRAARSGTESERPAVPEGSGDGLPNGAAPAAAAPAGYGDPRQLAPNVFYHSPAGRGSGSGGITASLTTALGSKPPLAGAAAGGIMKGIIRNRNSEMHRKMERSAEVITKGAKFFDVWTEAAPDDATREARFLEFTDAMQEVGGASIDQLPEPMREFARVGRDVADEHENELKNKGYLQTFIDHYMGQLWQDPNNPDATPQEIMARINSKRSLAGGEAYRKQRSIASYREGIEAGMIPKSWNPMDLIKMKADEVDKSIAGRDMFNEGKKQKLLVFQRLGATIREGWRMLDDKLARVMAPPETPITEYYDKQQMEGLENFASRLGINLERVTKGMGRSAGQAEIDMIPITDVMRKLNPGLTDHQIRAKLSQLNQAAGGSGLGGQATVKTKFGTPEEILAHEIGHVLDVRYGMSAWLKDPVVSKELADLADLRASGRVSGEYTAYLRSDPERMANLVAAYLHAPELLNSVAPNAMAHLESLLAAHKELQPLRDIKPSLELGQREQMKRVAGPMLTGNYYGPNEVIDAIEKHLSPGLSRNAAFQAFRGFGNAMNMMQLGWSAYHYTATALNAQISAAALGFRMMSRGDYAEAAKQLPKALVPLYAAERAVRQGLEMRRDYFVPGSGSPETQQLNEAWEQGGGRARMDQFYRGSQLDAFGKAVRQYQAGKSDQAMGVIGRMLPALNEAVSLPLMEHFVPLVKNGVGADMARYEMSKLPPGATVNEKRAIYGKIVDSIDNRFGQMIYDNLFWHRTMKDSLMTAFRSVGWNLGTGRELGGGLKDIPASVRGLKSGEGITDRLAYIGGLTAVTAMYGAMIQYLYTGKGPEEAKDFFFPKTGQKNKDGSPERKSLPVYMKDVYGVTNRADEGPVRIARNLWGMGKSKLHPAIIAVSDMLNNEDFHGQAIDNPNDPIWVGAKDDLAHFFKSFEPFSIRGFREQGASGGVQQFLGITNAPGYITKTSDEQRAAEAGRKVSLTPLAKKAKADKK